jgi:glycosyltransferase involved in cell wall biosynthesis
LDEKSKKLILSIPVTFFIDDKLGGVSSLNLNLIQHAPEGFSQIVIHLEDRSLNFARSSIQYPVDKQVQFVFDKKSNVYSVLEKMRKLVENKPGALVLNYGSEMAMLDHHQVYQTTYQLVHDAYNLDLAKIYGHLVDVFICHNAFIESELKKLFPSRLNDIFFLSHGVTIPEQFRKEKKADEPLRLLFLGRFAKSKGIFDLPQIAALLRKKNIKVKWTCIGSGPEEIEFKNSWHPDDEVAFLSPASNKEVLEICQQHDVFVLPTKFEGTPVSLLETMSVGLVPVITSLPGGIEEIVSSEIGYAVGMDNNEGFAAAISKLHYNRIELEELSCNCRKKIIEDFNIINTSKKYYELFSQYKQYKKEKKLKKLKVGSRLDHPMIPEKLVRIIRNVVN